jgi:hypothetical protein
LKRFNPINLKQRPKAATHQMSEQTNNQERIRELEKALQITRNELSHIGTQLIDERHLLERMHGLVYNVTRENTQLKRRIEELEAEAAQSEMRTQVDSSRSPRSPSMSPVSVPVSPRIHHHHHHHHNTSPRLSPETPEPTTSDANQRLINDSPRRAEWEEVEIDWEQREREDWFKDHTTVDYRRVTGI